MLKYLLTALLFAVSATAGVESPVVATIPLSNGMLMTVHADESVAFVELNAETNAVEWSKAIAEDPELTTSWIDALGVAHSVSTPVAGTTPAAIQRAVSRHKLLVDAMQALHPPRPVPTP